MRKTIEINDESVLSILKWTGAITLILVFANVFLKKPFLDIVAAVGILVIILLSFMLIHAKEDEKHEGFNEHVVEAVKAPEPDIHMEELKKKVETVNRIFEEKKEEEKKDEGEIKLL